MKRFAVLALVLAFTAACGDDDNPTSPSSTIVFTANMTAANEVPPIGNAESGASGTATVTFNVNRSGSTISSGTADMQFSLTGFPPGSNAILAHVHTGAAGVNGPVLINSGLSAATPVSMPSGTGTFSVTGIAVDGATIQSIIDNPSGFYFNVHTPLNPGGAVRAQLVRRS